MGLGQEFVTGTFTEEEESESQMGLAAQDINAAFSSRLCTE